MEHSSVRTVLLYLPTAREVGESIPSWGSMFFLILLVAIGIKGGASVASGVIPNPGIIATAAGKAVVDRTNILFEDVTKVGDELSSSIGSIRESLVQAAQTMRTFFTMITSFVISFQKMLQGLVGSALNIITVIKGILNSLFDTMTILIYTITTAMNLVGSVDNGPPGSAMRTMINIINAF
jgi:hypothetical protein